MVQGGLLFERRFISKEYGALPAILSLKISRRLCRNFSSADFCVHARLWLPPCRSCGPPERGGFPERGGRTSRYIKKSPLVLFLCVCSEHATPMSERVSLSSPRPSFAAGRLPPHGPGDGGRGPGPRRPPLLLQVTPPSGPHSPMLHGKFSEKF